MIATTAPDDRLICDLIAAREMLADPTEDIAVNLQSLPSWLYADLPDAQPLTA